MQNHGDMTFHEREWAGTRLHTLRMEGFKITIEAPINKSDLSMIYMAHLQNIGDIPWQKEGTFCGTRGQERRVDGFAIKLTGAKSEYFNIFYQAHIQNQGDSSILKNGEYCGTRGVGLRIQAIKVWIEM